MGAQFSLFFRLISMKAVYRCTFNKKLRVINIPVFCSLLGFELVLTLFLHIIIVEQ